MGRWPREDKADVPRRVRSAVDETLGLARGLSVRRASERHR